MMTTVLLTGFEAFGHTPINPAEQVARALDGKGLDDSKIVGRIVPNVFFKSIDYVVAAIEEVRPSIVVMMGEYGGRAVITGTQNRTDDSFHLGSLTRSA